MPHFVVTAVGADRPGIVAGVTGALKDLGSNLEDTSMSILRGHFAMMLIVKQPDGDANSIEKALDGVAQVLDLVVTVRQIDDTVPDSPSGEDWTLSVYGADQPGIVHRVTSLLAELSVNVVDVTTRLVGTPGSEIYLMLLEVTVPPGIDSSMVSSEVHGLANELGVDCSLRPSEADIL